MKTLLTLLFTVISFGTQAQVYWQENFESPYDYFSNKFSIDTVNYHHNIWQIGKPGKVVFDSAYSYPNAIVTDTLHTYPVNDTSVFYVYYNVYSHPGITNFVFMYKLDIDTQAIVKVELSGDRGLSWINTITDDSTYLFYWGGIKPRFDTTISNWRKYDLNMNIWANAYAGGPDTFAHYLIADTILFRFTFISGSDTSVHKDGWMMDNFMHQAGHIEGAVNEVKDAGYINIYPNPASDHFYINYGDNIYDDAKIVVFGINGSLVYEAKMPQDHILSLPLADGADFLKAINRDGYLSTKKIIIAR